MIKHKKMIAAFVVFAFLSLLQISAMPAAPSPSAETSMASSEKAPGFIEEEGSTAYQGKKKSMLPIVLIGVGVVAVAAVLFLVVLKTKYDLRGTWTLTRSADFWWIHNPRTFVFEGASRASGNMTISGFADGGPWTADGKNVSFTATTDASDYLWTFTGTFTDKDTLSGTVNYHDENYDIDGTWSAVRSGAAPAAQPQPAFASEKKPELDQR